MKLINLFVRYRFCLLSGHDYVALLAPLHDLLDRSLFRVLFFNVLKFELLLIAFAHHFKILGLFLGGFLSNHFLAIA
jgi:hypothetical protein